MKCKRLASDVGSLNRVLNNVKTRGHLGSAISRFAGTGVHLEQYAVNVETVPGSGRVSSSPFACPARATMRTRPCGCRLTQKFPREDYERLWMRMTEPMPQRWAGRQRHWSSACATRRAASRKTWRRPHTADFAILFMPTEGLYAEALRRPGLVEAMQRASTESCWLGPPLCWPL